MAGDKITSGPQVGYLATSPLDRGFPNASERGTNEKWPFNWPIGYITPAI